MGTWSQYHQSKQAGSCAKSPANVGTNVPQLALCDYSELQNLGKRARARAVWGTIVLLVFYLILQNVNFKGP